MIIQYIQYKNIPDNKIENCPINDIQILKISLIPHVFICTVFFFLLSYYPRNLFSSGDFFFIQRLWPYDVCTRYT